MLRYFRFGIQYTSYVKKSYIGQNFDSEVNYCPNQRKSSGNGTVVLVLVRITGYIKRETVLL